MPRGAPPGREAGEPPPRGRWGGREGDGTLGTAKRGFRGLPAKPDPRPSTTGPLGCLGLGVAWGAAVSVATVPMAHQQPGARRDARLSPRAGVVPFVALLLLQRRPVSGRALLVAGSGCPGHGLCRSNVQEQTRRQVALLNATAQDLFSLYVSVSCGVACPRGDPWAVCMCGRDGGTAGRWRRWGQGTRGWRSPLLPAEVPRRAVQQRERQALQPQRRLLPRLPRQPDEREEGGDGGHVQALRFPQRLAGEHHARPGGAQPHGQGAPRPAPQHHQDHPGPHLQPHLPPLQELQHLPGGRQLRGELQGQEHLQEEAAGLPGAQEVRAGHRPGGPRPPTSPQPPVSARPGSSAPHRCLPTSPLPIYYPGPCTGPVRPPVIYLPLVGWPSQPGVSRAEQSWGSLRWHRDAGQSRDAPQLSPSSLGVQGAASTARGWRRGRTLRPAAGPLHHGGQTDGHPQASSESICLLQEKGLGRRTPGCCGWQGAGDAGTPTFRDWASPWGAKLRVPGWPRWSGLGPAALDEATHGGRSRRLPWRGASSPRRGHGGVRRACPSPSEKCFSHRKGSECTSGQGLGLAWPNAAPARGHGDAGTQGWAPGRWQEALARSWHQSGLWGLFIASVESPACTERSDLTFHNVINNNN